MSAVQEHECVYCGKPFQVIPRPRDWSGDIRGEVQCPHCKNKYGWKSFPTGVRYPARPPVTLFRLNNGREVALEDYECSRDQAEAFAGTFRRAWERLPDAASEALTRHWSVKGDTPHIWLLEDREDWRGRGWAAASTDAQSMYFVSGIAIRMPAEHLQTLAAHELGHILFIASGEETHLRRRHEPMGNMRCEWLVWQLMTAWGYDQPAAEEWMERNFEDSPGVLRMRVRPLEGTEYEGKNAKWRQDVERDLPDKTFPASLTHYLQAGS